MIFTLIIFILILAILVLAHELGHFWIARRAGVRVDEFGFGFPPRIFKWQGKKTLYSINLIPIGGFVKIHGEQGEGKGDADSFASKGAGRRALILVAGVAMNFVLAMVLLGIGNMIGLPTSLEDANLSGGIVKSQKIQVIEVVKNSPAEEIGLKTGDEIKSLESPSGKKYPANADEVSSFIMKNVEQGILLEVQRGKDILKLSFMPRPNPPEGEGPLGVLLTNTAIVSFSWWKAIYYGIKDTVNLTIFIVSALGKIIYLAFIGQPVGEVLTGPVGIYNITSQAAGMGFIYILNLTALLSINLGLVNVLPFPALDGGRLLFLAVEKIKGSPINQKIENIIHTIGFAILIILMLFITWNDIAKIF